MTKIPIQPPQAEGPGGRAHLCAVGMHKLLALSSWAYSSRYYIKNMTTFRKEAKENTGRGARILMAKLASMN